jgi:hypothetical protein
MFIGRGSVIVSSISYVSVRRQTWWYMYIGKAILEKEGDDLLCELIVMND